jgi:hypothetical protein
VRLNLQALHGFDLQAESAVIPNLFHEKNDMKMSASSAVFSQGTNVGKYTLDGILKQIFTK